MIRIVTMLLLAGSLFTSREVLAQQDMPYGDSQEGRRARFASELVHYGPKVWSEVYVRENGRISEDLLLSIAEASSGDDLVCLMVAVAADLSLHDSSAKWNVCRVVRSRLRATSSTKLPDEETRRQEESDFRRIVRDLSYVMTERDPEQRVTRLLNCAADALKRGTPGLANAILLLRCQWEFRQGAKTDGELLRTVLSVSTRETETWRGSAVREMLRGDSQRNGRQFPTSKQSYEKALQLFKEHGDNIGIARSLARLAEWYEQNDQRATEEACFRQALAAYKRWYPEAVLLDHLLLEGWLRESEGRYLDAHRCYVKAIESSSSSTSFNQIAALLATGRTEIVLGRFDDARLRRESAGRLMDPDDAPEYLVADVTLFNAQLDYALDDLDRSLVRCRVAQDLYGDRARGLAQALILEAQIQIYARNWAEALRASDSAMVIARMAGLREEQIRSTVCRFQVLIGMQRAEYIQVTTRGLPRTNNAMLKGMFREVQGDALLAREGRRFANDAAQKYAEARREFQRAGYVIGEAGVLLKLGKMGLEEYRSRARDYFMDAGRLLDNHEAMGMRAQVLVYLATLESSESAKAEYMLKAVRLITQSRLNVILPRHQNAYIRNMDEILETIALYMLRTLCDGELFALEMMKTLADQRFNEPAGGMHQSNESTIALEAPWRAELVKRMSIMAGMAPSASDSLVMRICRNKIDSIRIDQLPQRGQLRTPIPTVLDSTQMFRKNVLQQGVTLLNYVILSDTLYVVLVSRERMESKALCRMGSADLEALRTQIHMLATLSDKNQGAADSAVKILGDLRRQMLEPVGHRLVGMSRVCVIQDDRLPTLPIEGMYLYSSEDGVVQHELSHLGITRYLSITHFIRNGGVAPWRANFEESDTVFAGLGYPTGKGGADSSLSIGSVATWGGGGGLRSKQGAKARPTLSASVRSPQGSSLISPRSTNLLMLEHADKEIDSIATYFKKLQSSVACYYAARKSQLVHALKQKVPFIHVACHGETDSSLHYLILDGSDGSDYILEVTEVAGWELSGIRLLTLAACHSGNTEVLNQDGISGFMRAFLRSGVRAVVGALWSIDDEIAKEMMVAFYRHVVADKSPADALALARAEVAKKGGLKRNKSYIQVQLSAYVLYGD